MKKINAIIRAGRLQSVTDSLRGISGLTGMTLSTVRGYGCRTWNSQVGSRHRMSSLTKFKAEAHTKIEIICTDSIVERVVSAIANAAKTGKPGDGKITIFPIDDVVRIETGARGEKAIHEQGIIFDHD